MTNSKIYSTLHGIFGKVTHTGGRLVQGRSLEEETITPDGGDGARADYC